MHLGNFYFYQFQSKIKSLSLFLEVKCKRCHLKIVYGTRLLNKNAENSVKLYAPWQFLFGNFYFYQFQSKIKSLNLFLAVKCKRCHLEFYVPWQFLINSSKNGINTKLLMRWILVNLQFKVTHKTVQSPIILNCLITST